MRYLTKDWVKDFRCVELITTASVTSDSDFSFHYREQKKQFFDNEKKSYVYAESVKFSHKCLREIKMNDKTNNQSNSLSNEKLYSIPFDETYYSKLFDSIISKNKEIILRLPNEVKSELENIDLIPLGVITLHDKHILDTFCHKETKRLELIAEKANYYTECAQDCLKKSVCLDDFKEEIVFDVIDKRGDLVIDFGKVSLVAEQVNIIEWETAVIEKWDVNNPYCGVTFLKAVELYSPDEDNFELHLLFESLNGLEQSCLWQVTVTTKNIYVRR